MGPEPLKDDVLEQRLKRLEASFAKLAELLREWLEEPSAEQCSQVA